MRRRITTHLAAPLLFTTLCATALAAPPAKTHAAPAAAPAQPDLRTPSPDLLPPSFDGWVESAKPVAGTKAAEADPANTAALADYGFLRYAIDQYSRTGVNGNTDTLTVKALQFPDSTGAFGAFTLYRRPNMAAEDIGSTFPGSKDLGTGGASGPVGGVCAGICPEQVLFWSGTVLIDAQFSHIDAMTAAEMRDLVKLLPPPTSSRALIPPPLPRYLPSTGLQAMSVRYALGNSSYQASGGVLPASIADFDHDSEVVTADYNIQGGDGTLTLVEYPTPQLAMVQEKALNDLITTLKSPQNPPQNAIKSPQNTAKIVQFWPQSLTSSSPAALQVRRSGPLLAFTSGNFTQRQAQLLLGAVHYDADIIWNNTQGYVPETTKTAKLLVGIILLSTVICLIALALGIALGGGRALIRVLRGKPASAVDEVFEFTKLNLRD